ncbi:CRISPR-associated protein Cmr6 [Tepidicella xavieri]|uniref:CRISPR-associated protein Cmr6 n=2 Tax=Tepidicella xavieri TaxID=360241 RepID=A0A4R6UGP0_9BURK|nr:CRISPR-associated protein Cmr6 [Tepidicella xavieri]
MPVAAVPEYLGSDFTDASPALRFGMYLNLWGVNRRTREVLWTTHDIDSDVRGQERQERDIRVENKTSALRESGRLTERDKSLMLALSRRLESCARTVPPGALLRLQAHAKAPFTTGLGNEHPLENGFAFLNPYGLPYLPGSGVKGVLRRAAQELADGLWSDAHGWSHETIAAIDKPKVGLSVIDVLFGREPAGGETEHVRGVLSFWDVIPQIVGDRLLVEVMTPHQSHYFQQKRDLKSGNSSTPHDSGQPNPISFLTVPPKSAFSFIVACDVARLGRLVPDLLKDEQGQPRWKHLLIAAFEHAFQWLGFGAKTAVGYGAMAMDREALHRALQAEQQAAEQARREAELSALSENQRTIAQLQQKLQQRQQELRGRKENWGQALTSAVQATVAQAKNESWTAQERHQLARMLMQWLPQAIQIDWKDARKKLGIGDWLTTPEAPTS